MVACFLQSKLLPLTRAVWQLKDVDQRPAITGSFLKFSEREEAPGDLNCDNALLLRLAIKGFCWLLWHFAGS
jgi:hypothetical protein